jgi:hypothetical protein
MLTNEKIDTRVRILAGALMRDHKIKAEDEAIVIAGVELLVNLLQNINTLAHTARGERP